jgi:GT2 family glycosyltransferase
MSVDSLSKIGVVAIGRNEGHRLQKCLRSVVGRVAKVVYVDSGSDDGSVAFAESIGVDVVVLDMSKPFTAARARNEGFKCLMTLSPELEYVQFVDGDCEIVEGWFDNAVSVLEQQKDVAVACGRRRERYPNASIYNQLCDIEWNTPVGEADACGGDALMRCEPFKMLGGYNSSVIAGEEPELCVRLRLDGWRIIRIDSEMTLHDANMTRFSQWWKRSTRTGHAYAEGYAMHGQSRFRHYARQIRSIFIWGMLVPLLIIFGLILTLWTPWSVLIILGSFIGYGKIVIRSYSSGRSRTDEKGAPWVYGVSCALAKFPQLFGAIRYYLTHWQGKQSKLIEYKNQGM